MSSLNDLSRLSDRPGFPWLVLLRAGGLALGWPQLAISFAAVLAFWLGTLIIGWWSPRETPDLCSTKLIEVVSIELAAEKSLPVGIIPFPAWEPGQWNPLVPLLAPWSAVVAPLYALVAKTEPVLFGTAKHPENTFAQLVNLAFALVLWSLFGVASCRAVAVQFAQERSESWPATMRYARARWYSTLLAPLIPAGGMLLMFLSLSFAAWFGRLPLVGGPLVTLSAPLLFLAGAALACLALIIVCGWPLMVAATAVDDCDSFGALSRACSFLTGCPVAAIGQALVSAVYGSVLVALLGGGFTLALLVESKPFERFGAAETWGAVMNCSHVTAQVLLATFAVSLFWSLATLNYLLLRQAVDRKPLEELAPGNDPTGPRELPIVGIPATDYRPESSDERPMNVEAKAN